MKLIDSCITQRKAQGPSRTCNESKEEEGAGSHILVNLVGKLARRGHDERQRPFARVLQRNREHLVEV